VSPEATVHLAEQFEDPAKQAHASRLAMWIFLATEILLFSGLFVSYAAYRTEYPDEFRLASHHLKTWIGTLNTFVLLTSSFTVAMSLHLGRTGRGRKAALLLLASIALALVFMGLKGLEYYDDFREGVLPGRLLAIPELRTPGVAIFLALYFLMTGLHAIHVTAGVAVLSWLTVLSWRGTFSAHYDTPLEVGAMYWHLVDVIWIFLWPLLYLL
jgi:cytochrome c oxidase subunit 3